MAAQGPSRVHIRCTSRRCLSAICAELAYNNTLRTGAIADGITGVLTYSNGDWRVHPTGPTTFDLTANARTGLPDVGAARLTVTSFNVLNFFNNGEFCFSSVNHPNDNLSSVHLSVLCFRCSSSTSEQSMRATGLLEDAAHTGSDA